MAIKTNRFTDRIVDLFHDYVVQNDTFIFGSDFALANTTINSEASQLDVLEKTIFGLKVEEADVAYMIPWISWEPGITFAMYDDQADLSNANFYVVVEPEEQTADYHVFKCIFNNNGGLSSDKPLYTETLNETGGESNLADGYIWKYMYTVPYSTMSKFATQGFFPIYEDEEVEDEAEDGIHTILVENFNTNFGYEKVAGVIDLVPNDNGRTALSISDTFIFNEAIDNYFGSVLYVTKQEGDEIIASKQYVISGSGRVGLTYYVDIEGYSGTDLGGNGIEKFDQFVILPRVIIEGTGTDAEGIVVFDDTNTRINSVQIIVRGSEYFAASAYIDDPRYLNVNAGDVRATLRPIISPEGGHGSHAVSELRSNAVCIAKTITSDATEVTDTNFYSKVALVAQPGFEAGTPDDFDNRVELEVSSTTGAEIGMVISQDSGVSGIIHEIDGSDTIYVVNYLGAYDAEFEAGSLSLGSVDINISNVTYPPYVQRSGDVFYVADFQPIERTDAKSEVIKILVDF